MVFDDLGLREKKEGRRVKFLTFLENASIEEKLVPLMRMDLLITLQPDFREHTHENNPKLGQKRV